MTVSKVFVALLGAAVLAPYGVGREVCRFKDRQIHESSGIASSARSDEYFFTHNDSGGGPVLFAVDRSGETVGSWRVRGAEAVDWEDMARGPGENGGSVLYIGDIGDNRLRRRRIVVYRIPEPVVDPKAKGAAGPKGATALAERFELAYRDGVHDAETLLVHPKTGQVFVVTKTDQDSGLYAAPVPLEPGKVNQLRRVAELRVSGYPDSASGFKERLLRILTTGGAFSPDGTRLVVRTYTDAYEWGIPGGDVAAAVRKKPLHIPLPKTEQGEAITYSRDGSALLITSEGKNAPVHELRRGG